MAVAFIPTLILFILFHLFVIGIGIMSPFIRKELDEFENFIQFRSDYDPETNEYLGPNLKSSFAFRTFNGSPKPTTIIL